MLKVKLSTAVASVAAIAVVAVPVASALAGGQDSAPTSPISEVDASKVDPAVLVPSPDWDSSPPVTDVAKSLTDAFSIFRSAPTGALERSSQQSAFGVNRSLGRDISTAVGVMATVLPGKDAVCLRVRWENGSVGITCQPSDLVLKGELVMRHGAPGSEPGRGQGDTTVGVAPDGVRSVLFRDGVAPSTVVDVSNNVWATKGRTAEAAVLVGDGPADGSTIDLP